MVLFVAFQNPASVFVNKNGPSACESEIKNIVPIKITAKVTKTLFFAKFTIVEELTPKNMKNKNTTKTNTPKISIHGVKDLMKIVPSGTTIKSIATANAAIASNPFTPPSAFDFCKSA